MNVEAGDSPPGLRTIRYVLTLDEDTPAAKGHRDKAHTNHCTSSE